jgi:hypothetical protein
MHVKKMRSSRRGLYFDAVLSQNLTLKESAKGMNENFSGINGKCLRGEWIPSSAGCLQIEAPLYGIYAFKSSIANPSIAAADSVLTELGAAVVAATSATGAVVGSTQASIPA